MSTESPCTSDPLRIVDVRTLVLRAPLLEPVQPSFGLMQDCPALLVRNSKTPLAAGENLRGIEAFETAIGASALSVIQPDLGKWGGFSGCVEVGKMSRAHGVMFCPHWPGGGVDLATIERFRVQ